jgi:hypothetical protein
MVCWKCWNWNKAVGVGCNRQRRCAPVFEAPGLPRLTHAHVPCAPRSFPQLKFAPQANILLPRKLRAGTASLLLSSSYTDNPIPDGKLNSQKASKSFLALSALSSRRPLASTSISRLTLHPSRIASTLRLGTRSSFRYLSSSSTLPAMAEVKWTGPLVRKTFLDYFAERGHAIGKPSPLPLPSLCRMRPVRCTSSDACVDIALPRSPVVVGRPAQ